MLQGHMTALWKPDRVSSPAIFPNTARMAYSSVIVDFWQMTKKRYTRAHDSLTHDSLVMSHDLRNQWNHKHWLSKPELELNQNKNQKHSLYKLGPTNTSPLDL